MTQYRTLNPLGSMAPKDLYDNAQNVDNWSNGGEPYYEDRFGILRRSFSGMNFEFEAAQDGRDVAFDTSLTDKESRFQAFLLSSGYVSKGDYAAGVVLEERNEYVAVDAATTGTTAGLYRPNASATLPLTLTGTWATDETSLVLLGDDVLRQEMAAVGGAGLVGWERTALAESAVSVGKMLSALTVNVWEFSSLITDKPTAADPSTWDWSPAFNGAIASLPATGGAVYAPKGVYTLKTDNPNHACIWVSKNNVTLFGDGAGTILRVTNNQHVPIHVSPERDVLVTNIPAADVENFECSRLCVAGTGVYQNYGLGYGRGILLRKVKNAIIRDNFVFDMSMIGICVEHGSGNFLITNNVVGRCKYTAINFNGRAYQSIISNNICFGSDGDANSVAIQATGHSMVVNNTVYGSPGNHANCGGIMWGEGPYTGIGAIRGNLVKHCRYGIKAVYHGPCQISGNTIINCMTQGGIVTVAGVETGFQVASADNLISNNMLVNNYPTQIDCNSPNTVIQANKAFRTVEPVNPSIGTEPDAVIDLIPEYSIYIGANGCSVIGNHMRGSQRGLVLKRGISLSVVSANDIPSLAAAGLVAYESESTPGILVALCDLFERRSAGNGLYQARIFGPSKPSQGFWKTGDLWERVPAGVGQSLGEVVINDVATTTTASSAADSTTITTASPASAAGGNLLGVELDNGAWHWTSATAVSGLTVTLASAVPSGRTVPSGAAVVSQQWRALAALA